MRVIITGGTGLIGTALARSLGDDGHEVIVLSRSPRQPGRVPATVRYVQWDARAANGWGKLAEGADAIVNFAGASINGEHFFPDRWTDERKQAIVESRVNAGKAVVEAVQAAAVKPKVVVQASAVGYYGVRGSEDIPEETAPGNDFLANVCKQWEASTEPVESMGVRRAIIRTGLLLTLDGGVLTRLAFPFRLFAGGPIGSGRQQMPWIHMDDEIAAIRFLIDTPNAGGAFNLSASNPVTNLEFARALGRVMGRPSFMPAPGFAFKLAFGEVATLVLDGQRAIPKRLIEHGFAFKFTTLEPALRDLFGRRAQKAG